MANSATPPAGPQQQPAVIPQPEKKQPQPEKKQPQLIDEILPTQSPVAGQDVDVKPLLQLVEEILQRSITPTPEGAPKHAPDEKTQQEKFVGKLEALSDTINKISSEISYACSGGEDAHMTTIALLKTMSSYSWDAKVVLGLAALSVTYGEFLLVAEFYSTHPLAKSIALLKQLPDTLEYSESLKPRFESLKSLIKAMIDVTKCVVRFKELPPEQRPSSASSVEANDIPVAVYWIIRSVVASASEIIGLIGLANEYIPSKIKAEELSSLTIKVINILDHLKEVAPNSYQHIDEKVEIKDEKQGEAHLSLRLFKTIHVDNIRILRALIYAKDDLQPLFEGLTKKQVEVEVLTRKNMLLLISDLDISQEGLSILEWIYKESREQPTKPESEYEMVWLPVVDKIVPWTKEKKEVLERLQSMMPWYSVHHPSLIKDPLAIKYIKDVWHFDKKPILVVLDEGRVVNLNALHMIWIWRSQAFPFTREREEALWKEETWRLELLVDDFVQNILNWIKEERFICLYGGEDIEWIRKFTSTARGVAQEAQIPFEMVYVGKSNPKEGVKRNIDVINTEKLSSCLPDLTSIWFFWIRLESMGYSKMQQGKTIENDNIMKEITTMLTFDGSEQGWALISRGSSNMAKAKGDMILSCFQQYDQWKEVAGEKGFMQAFNDNLQKLQTPHQ